MDGYEQDVQVAKDGACDGVEGGNGHPSQIQSSLQPQEVHAASVVRLPGLEGLSESRLSRLGRPPARHARLVRSNRIGRSAAFHHVSEGGSTLVASSAGGPTAERNRRADHGRKHRVPLAAIDSTGLESRHTSRYFIHRRSRVPNLWQTTQYTRYPKLGILVDCSNHVVLGYLTDQGPKPDIRDLAPTLAQTMSSCTNRMVDCRRGLRQRVEPSAVSRRTWHSFAHSSEARPSHGQAGQRPLSAVDAEAIRQSPLRSALASGNGGKHDEASPRISPRAIAP